MCASCSSVAIYYEMRGLASSSYLSYGALMSTISTSTVTWQELIINTNDGVISNSSNIICNHACY